MKCLSNKFTDIFLLSGKITKSVNSRFIDIL